MKVYKAIWKYLKVFECILKYMKVYEPTCSTLFFSNFFWVHFFVIDLFSAFLKVYRPWEVSYLFLIKVHVECIKIMCGDFLGPDL